MVCVFPRSSMLWLLYSFFVFEGREFSYTILSAGDSHGRRAREVFQASRSRACMWIFFLPITSLQQMEIHSFVAAYNSVSLCCLVSLLNCFLPRCYITAYTVLNLTFPDIPWGRTRVQPLPNSISLWTLLCCSK